MDELFPWSPGLGENGFTPNIMREHRITPGKNYSPLQTSSYLNSSSKSLIKNPSHDALMSPNDMMDSSSAEAFSPTTQSLLMMSPPPELKNDTRKGPKFGGNSSKCSPVPGHSMPPPRSKKGGTSAANFKVRFLYLPNIIR